MEKDYDLKWICEDEEYFKQILELRYQILRKPINMKRGTENNLLDGKKETKHLAAIFEGNVIGCVSIYESNQTLKIFQMLVDIDFQKKGIGRNLIKKNSR
ncbi:gnat family n-acetyltransferase [Anaeramoeba ignava]|uniref:Gnat family n-acetyltransferase n=1 Tax=Anaeramoeba ignava TaxID=1746090 RepID=A0A9Q0LPI0_ANAIG|nr:gnat family n-acetyltransferase [Anaeramoeba ignava]